MEKDKFSNKGKVSPERWGAKSDVDYEHQIKKWLLNETYIGGYLTSEIALLRTHIAFIIMLDFVAIFIVEWVF